MKTFSFHFTVPNKIGNTPLLYAASNGHLKIVQWLLDIGGAHIDQKNNYGWTALLLAAAKGHLDMVQWLIQACGAHISERNCSNTTALQLAESNGQLQVMQWLLQAGGASIIEADFEKIGLLLDADEPTKGWLMNQKAEAKCTADKLSKGEKLPYIRLHYLDQKDAKLLCNALQNFNCPSDITLDLQNALCNTKVYLLITEALKSGKFPEKILLNLAHNQLGFEGARIMSQVLLSGKCSAKLELNFSHNNIGSKGYKLLMGVFDNDRCPKGLRIQINSDNVLADRYCCVIMEQGRRQFNARLNYLPQEILEKVYSYLNPYFNNDLRYHTFPRRVVQVVDKSHKDSLIIRLKYFINIFQPNAYSIGAKDRTITEKSYKWLKCTASSIGNLVYKPISLTKQLISEIKQLISISTIEVIRLSLNETINNYIEKMSLNNSSEKTTVNQLLKYQLIEYDQYTKYKELLNTFGAKNTLDGKLQKMPNEMVESKKQSYSFFNLFNKNLSQMKLVNATLESEETLPTKQMTIYKQ